MNRHVSTARRWSSSFTAGCFFVGSACLPGCGDTHLNFGPYQTASGNARDALNSYATSSTGITPTAEKDITALSQLQQTVASAQLDYDDSRHSYDAINETWQGLRADFLTQVGLLPESGKITPEMIDNASDQVDYEINLRLTKVATVINLLNQLVQTETQLAEQSQKKLQTSAAIINNNSALTTAPSNNSSGTLSQSELVQFSQIEKYVLQAAKTAQASRASAQNLSNGQLSAQKAEATLLQQIEASRDSDVVAAIAPLIGSGLDKDSMDALDTFILELDAMINSPSANSNTGSKSSPAPHSASNGGQPRTDASVAISGVTPIFLYDQPLSAVPEVPSIQEVHETNLLNKQFGGSITVAGSPFFKISVQYKAPAPKALVDADLVAPSNLFSLPHRASLITFKAGIQNDDGDVAFVTKRQIAQAAAACRGARSGKGKKFLIAQAYFLHHLKEVQDSTTLKTNLAMVLEPATMPGAGSPNDASNARDETFLKSAASQLGSESVVSLQASADNLQILAVQSSRRRRDLSSLRTTLDSSKTNGRRNNRAAELYGSRTLGQLMGSDPNYEEKLRTGAETYRISSGGVGLTTPVPTPGSGVVSSVQASAVKAVLAANIKITLDQIEKKSDEWKVVSLANNVKTSNDLLQTMAQLTAIKDQAKRGEGETGGLNNHVDTKTLLNKAMDTAKNLVSVPTSMEPEEVTQALSTLSSQLTDFLQRMQTTDSSQTPDDGNAASALGNVTKALQNLITSNQKTLGTVLQTMQSQGTLSGILYPSSLSATWLDDIALLTSSVQQGELGQPGNPGSGILFSNPQAVNALNNLDTKLLSIITSDTDQRLSLIQDYLNQLYQHQIDIYQEQERHYKTIIQIAQLETTRWTILQQINQNVSVAYASLYFDSNKTIPGLSSSGTQPGSYYPFVAAEPDDYKTAETACAKVASQPATAPVPTTAPSSSNPPSPKALRNAQVARLNGLVNDHLAKFAPFPASPPLDQYPVQDSQIFASLRVLAFAAKSRFVQPPGDAGKTDLFLPEYQEGALAINQRLTDLIKLLNNSLLMNAINLKFSLDDARRLKQELMEHDLQLDQLESAVQLANLQYSANDLQIYHSGGITKEDLESIGEDAAVIFIASKRVK